MTSKAKPALVWVVAGGAAAIASSVLFGPRSPFDLTLQQRLATAISIAGLSSGAALIFTLSARWSERSRGWWGSVLIGGSLICAGVSSLAWAARLPSLMAAASVAFLLCFMCAAVFILLGDQETKK